jgi:hypothetical protein
LYALKKIFIILLSFAAVISVNSQTSNPKYEKWQSSSFFRGYNILYENPKTLQDVIDFKNYGGNLLEIGVFGFMDEDPPYGIQQQNIDGTDLLVGFCRQAGVHYVLAIRSGPGAYDTYLETQGLTEESRIWNSGNDPERLLYSDMLNMIVNRYLNDSLFVGITLIVEPRPKVMLIPANNSDLYKFFLENVFNIHMDQVFQFFTSRLRTVDPELPVIIENFAYSTPELFPAYEISDPYIIYSAHNYQPKEFTAADTPFTRTYPGTYWNITFLAQKFFDQAFMRETVFGRLREFQETVGTPIFIGEIGMLYPQHGSNTFLGDNLKIFTDFGWHYALWDWRRGPGQEWNIENFEVDTTSVSIPDWQVVLSYFYGAPASDKGGIRSPVPISGENISHKKPIEFLMKQNAPNPFNPSTNINIDLPENGFVKLVIYDVTGREVEVLVNEHKSAGMHTVTFDASGLPSGVYIYKLYSVTSTGKEFNEVKKMVLVK